MTIRCIAVLVLVFVSSAGTAADATHNVPPDPAVVTPPSTASTVDDTRSTSADTTQDDADTVAKPKADSKVDGSANPDGDFKPSENISEDMSVAYPVDI